MPITRVSILATLHSLLQTLRGDILPEHEPAVDRTFSGLCDWVEAEALRPVDLLVDGAASLKAAVIPFILRYSTADPLA